MSFMRAIKPFGSGSVLDPRNQNEGLGRDRMRPWAAGPDPVYDQNVPRNALGVRLDAEKYAADTQAALTRDQWDTYLRTFVPVEDNLIKYATNMALPAENAERAIAGVNQAFEQQTGIAERRMKAYGIQATPEQTAAIDRNIKLNKGLAEVQAANTARDATISRQRSIMGGAPGGGII